MNMSTTMNINVFTFVLIVIVIIAGNTKANGKYDL